MKNPTQKVMYNCTMHHDTAKFTKELRLQNMIKIDIATQKGFHRECSETYDPCCVLLFIRVNRIDETTRSRYLSHRLNTWFYSIIFLHCIWSPERFGNQHCFLQPTGVTIFVFDLDQDCLSCASLFKGKSAWRNWAKIEVSISLMPPSAPRVIIAIMCLRPPPSPTPPWNAVSFVSNQVESTIPSPQSHIC